METKSDPGQAQRCCCTHGQRCTCALKKEPLSSVPEMNPPALPGPLRRNSSNKKLRLAKAGSDTTVAAFAKRPMSSHGETSLSSAGGFKVPIPHSVPLKAPVRRSTDSLPTLKRKIQHGPDIGATGPRPKMRISKSEAGSPGPRDMAQGAPLQFDFTLDNIPQFDFTSSFYTPQEEAQNLSGYNMSPPTEWPAFDAHLDDYTTYNSHPNNPYGAFDHQPIAATSSGEVSEISDYLSHPSSRPQLSAANSDDSQVKRLSPAIYPSLSGASSAVVSEENLANRVQNALQKPSHKGPSNLSNESLSSQVSPQHSYHGLPQSNLAHTMSPVGQQFDTMPRAESMEEAFLPPTSSPKVNTGHFSPTSAPLQKGPVSNASMSARPPTSSPKQLNFPEQLSSPNYNAPLSLQEDRAFHPTEGIPTDFPHLSPVSQPQRYAQQNQAAQVSHSIPIPQSAPPEYTTAGQQSTTFAKPVELTPEQFGSASPLSQSAPQQRPREGVRRQSYHGQSTAIKSPAIGGTDDFTRQGFSLQDAQRLAHSQSAELTQGMLSPSEYERHAMSVYDLQQLAHPETSSESSSGPSSAGHDGRPDPFRHLGGLSAQNTQRLAFPSTPTEALSGLTIPQTTTRHDGNVNIHNNVNAATNRHGNGGAEAQIFWASGGGQQYTNGRSTSSFVSQQEVEGPSGWQ